VKWSLKAPIFASIAIGTGIVILLGYFIKIPFLLNLRAAFLQWALILTSVAVFVGVLNLIRIHFHKIKSGEKGNIYSLVLLISFVLVFLIAMVFGPTDIWSLWLFNYILLPIESSLLALLAVILVYAAARQFYRRSNLFTLIFTGTTVFILISTFALPGFEIPGLSDLRILISQVISVAGARGILLGVALGTIATGIRILLGADRPYGG